MAKDKQHEERRELKDQIEDLVKELDSIHKNLKAFANKIESLETRAGELGLDRVKFALRDAYVQISQSGAKLVDAHLDLNVPPTVYE